MDRRYFLWAGLAGISTLAAAGALTPAQAPTLSPALESRLKQGITAAEKASGGRLGVGIFDTATGAIFSHRGAERFPMCSTFKLLLVTAVLCRVDRGDETLARRVAVVKADILGNSPFSATRVASTASLAELAEATITSSDNTAANLLLPVVGGPSGLTHFLRGLGDDVTRLDRNEPTMSDSTPGDPRDTTSPEAMVRTVQRILFTDVLKPASRALLEGWLRASQTGAHRLRAGLPPSWQVANKTGTGSHGTTNDVAILWPPGRPPLIVASYLTTSPLNGPKREAIHASVARAIANAF